MEICVAICTYKRLSIKATLESIAKQRLPNNLTIKVLVADNDETNKAEGFIRDCAEEFRLKLEYVHAPSNNISIARNVCLDNAQADWMACIDDDEIASIDWIANLYESAIQENAAVVFGPVKAIYPKSTPEWMESCDFHSFTPTAVKGIYKTGASGNAFVNLNHHACKGIRFDLALGKSGGEDSNFFSNVFSNGGYFVFAPNALVTEDVALHRASLSWLLKRKFRFGQTCGALLLDNGQSMMSKINNILKALCKFLYCYLMCLFCLLNTNKKYRWLLRGTLHLGVFAKLLGKKEIKQY